MANITKRGNAYRIRTSCGYDVSGRQIVKTMTWKPAPDMTQRQIEKELNRQATLFEERAKSRQSIGGNVRFAEYAAQWMEFAQLAPATRSQYEDLLSRINSAIGHIRLEKLQAHHIEAFYKNLREKGINLNGSYAESKKLAEYMEKRKLSNQDVSKVSGVSPETIRTIKNGKKASVITANKIAKGLEVDISSLFSIHRNESGLSSKTILHHHRLISAILAKAKKDRIIPNNVAAEHVDAPKVKKRQPAFLNDEQARQMVESLLDESDVRIKTSLLLLLYSGLRRGELCGLCWSDINTGTGLIQVMRASQYQEGKGIVTVPTKNESSVRSIKVPPFIFDILSEYKVWWIEQRFQVGDAWKDKDQRLFIQSDGKPIAPDTINKWLRQFLESHDLPRITPHSLRHTFATLQIAAGVDLKTLQARGGWAQADTPMKIYAHSIKSAAEAASDVMDQILTPANLKKA